MSSQLLNDEISIIEKEIDKNELLQFKEKDGCYTWAFPLRYGHFDPIKIWHKSELPVLSDKLTIYVHIPFCKFVCSMCPFTHESLKNAKLDDYVEAIIKEIDIYSRHELISKKSVTSIYFGGGTASTLSSKQVDRILTKFHQKFNISENCQITLEGHPQTINNQYLKEIHSAGINRVSFGIQSFNQDYLNSLHLYQKADHNKKLISEAMDIGFKTVAIDLMYRFANQKMEDLSSDLEEAISLGIQGLSMYSLDPDVRELEKTKNAQPSIDLEEKMYFYIMDKLAENGFVHVAQPDFSKKGHESQHLYDIWGAPQAENIAFGAGAFSQLFNGNSWCNIHSSNEYIKSLNDNNLPILMGQSNSLDDSMARYAVLGVRCLEVPLKPFKNIFNIDFTDLYNFEIQQLLKHDLIDIDNEYLKVTRKGKFWIDNVSKAFFNLSNRGKKQFWGSKFTKLLPNKVCNFNEIINCKKENLK